MDPLSALSVAANIVQFVAYGIDIVSKGNQLYKSADGAFAENIELETASLRLQQLSETVQGSLRQAHQGIPKGLSAQSDQALEKICEECIAVSKELVEKLEKLKIPGRHPLKKWKSFRQALKSVWSKEKIEEVAQRLANLRRELDTHVVMSLREHVTSISIQQDARFTSLNNDVKRIITALIVRNKARQADIDSRFNALSLFVEEEHAKTREALEDQAENRYQRKAELQILESLSFEAMKHRYEAIPEAHKLTFEWIFRDPDSEAKPWSNFISWAKSDSGIYWITGKAGCGKSTLMRFIVDDPRTRSYLEKWAPSEALITPAFFFWNSGVPEQRSQAGLFRSIIHEVLQKNTDLIPVVLPDEWRKALELSKHEVQSVPENWSLSRLHKAFKRLVGHSCASLRFCFFIDGLDEYEGDQEDISNYFSNLSNLPYVKFCIASRPLIVFKDAFSTFPGLRLQDLTSDDIQKYIEDKLNGHKRMKLLTKQTPIESEQLVRQVILKAEGVFLWVTLVITSLMKGLSQRDGIKQLSKRLDTFPSDLELLYGHMLSSIDRIYMEEGSRIFQVYRAQEIIADEVSLEMTYVALITDLLRVYGTAKDDLKRARKEDVEVLDLGTDFATSGASIYAFESLFEYMDDRVRTRCGGLIECNHYPSINKTRPQAYLQYIHRTVKDYLDKEDIWNDLCRHTEKISGLDSYLQILMSHVLCFKRLLLKESIHQYVWAIEDKSFDLDTQYHLLDEFDRAATELAHKHNPPKLKLHWSNYKLPPAWKTNFLCEAIRQVLPLYVRKRLSLNGASIKRESGLPFLGFTFLAKWTGVLTYQELELINILLESGADPKEIYEGYTIWQYFVHSLHARLPPEKGSAMTLDYRNALKQRVKALMERGVDLDVCCIKESGVWERLYRVGEPEGNSSEELHGAVASLWIEFAKHASNNDAEDGDAKNLNNSDSASTVSSTSQINSSGLLSRNTIRQSDSYGIGTVDGDNIVGSNDGERDDAQTEPSLQVKPEENVEDDPLFEDYHSLTTIFKEWFETEDDPHGADDILELMGRLKATKAMTQKMDGESSDSGIEVKVRGSTTW